MNIKWTDSFLTGVKKIDEEHKVIFKLMDNAYRVATNDGASEADIMMEFTNLLTMVSKHIDTEERIMVELNYPDTETHKRQHAHFMSVLHNAVAHTIAGKSADDKLILFMRNWVACHVMISDKELGLFYRSKTKLKKSTSITSVDMDLLMIK